MKTKEHKMEVRSCQSRLRYKFEGLIILFAALLVVSALLFRILSVYIPARSPDENLIVAMVDCVNGTVYVQIYNPLNSPIKTEEVKIIKVSYMVDKSGFMRGIEENATVNWTDVNNEPVIIIQPDTLVKFVASCNTSVYQCTFIIYYGKRTERVHVPCVQRY